jgi:hypothetical protein
MIEIVFTPMVLFNEKFNPKPSSFSIPEWYREMESYHDNIKKPNKSERHTQSTIKRCMPVFDMITAGYTLELSQDVYCEYKNGETHFQWSSDKVAVEYHDSAQVGTHPAGHGNLTPKFINYWSIKTPKNYSCLFIQPSHKELPFTIFPAIVDTDKFFNPVNFPFVLKNKEWEGLIPAGTAVAQVIPFLRNEYKMRIGNQEDEREAQLSALPLWSKFSNAYKTFFWQQKKYQ